MRPRPGAPRRSNAGEISGWGACLAAPPGNAPRAGAGPKTIVSDGPERVEEDNAHAVVGLVEWKPERGLFQVGGLAESEPAHPWWHLPSCLFRQMDVDWI